MFVPDFLPVCPPTPPVRPQKLSSKSLCCNHLPITHLFPILCNVNRSYLQQNKGWGRGRGTHTAAPIPFWEVRMVELLKRVQGRGLVVMHIEDRVEPCYLE